MRKLSFFVLCAVVGWVMYAPAASATLVTIHFSGPVNGVFYADPSSGFESLLTGHVTYSTQVSGTDGRNPFDRGDRNFYPTAVVSFAFSTPQFQRSFSTGGVQLFNDYQPCLGRSGGACIMFGDPEADVLQFVQALIDDSYSLVITGIDQSLLDSGLLPEDFALDDVAKVDFFWDSSEGELGSNRIRIDQVSVPEPSTLTMIVLGLAGLAAVRRLRRAPAT